MKSLHRKPDIRNKVMVVGRFVKKEFLFSFAIASVSTFLFGLVVFVPFAAIYKLSFFIFFVLLTCTGVWLHTKHLYGNNPTDGFFISNPILQLSQRGIDLLEFTELFQLNVQDMEKRLAQIYEHIEGLNQKIEQVKEDMMRIFQVVTFLATEEVNLIDTVKSASDEIRFMFEIINAVINEIELRNDTIEALVSQSELGKQKVTMTSESIEKLAKSSDGMLKMIDFINGISKKTNLLAINASIEATHSGGGGEGFTVIAEEMKNLAVLTSQNAKEISKLLLGNISHYSTASKVSKESGEAFVFINLGVQTVHGTIAEVLQTIAELKNRGNIVLGKTVKLDEIAVKVKNTSGEVYGEVVLINSAIDDLVHLSNGIKEEIDSLKTSLHWLLRMTARFNSGMEGIFQETDQSIGIPSPKT